LRSGAFAPDFPFVIVVVACGDCLPIPSGASTRPARPRPTPHPAAVKSAWRSAGRLAFL